MKIGIMSDSHDNVPNIIKAIGIFNEQAECVFHAGDIVAPFSVKELLKFKGPLYVVFGNNDGERKGIQKLIPDIRNGPRVVKLNDTVVCLSHSIEDIGKNAYPEFDIIVAGHSHKLEISASAKPVIINPGECGGWLTGRATVVLYDTDTHQHEVIEL